LIPETTEAYWKERSVIRREDVVDTDAFTAHEVSKSTHLHDAFVGFARQRHDYTVYFILIGSSETGTVSDRLVLNTCIPNSNVAVHTRVRELQFCSVHLL